MTDTPPATIKPIDHDRPCFCDYCFCTTMQDLVDERGRLLDASLRDGLYVPGDEVSLAEEIISAIPAARHRAVLEYMVTWEHLSPRVMAVDCLLDECDSRSYKALEEMAGILLAAIDAQDAAPRALRVLVTNAIVQEQKMTPLRRQLEASRAARS